VQSGSGVKQEETRRKGMETEGKGRGTDGGGHSSACLACSRDVQSSRGVGRIRCLLPWIRVGGGGHEIVSDWESELARVGCVRECMEMMKSGGGTRRRV
jgi:hypothetical protein